MVFTSTCKGTWGAQFSAHTEHIYRQTPGTEEKSYGQVQINHTDTSSAPTCTGRGEEQFLQWVVSDCRGLRQAFAALMEKSFRFNAKSVHSV